jgi:hypothetical protein
MDLGVEAYPMTILLDKECTECLWRTYWRRTRRAIESIDIFFKITVIDVFHYQKMKNDLFQYFVFTSDKINVNKEKWRVTKKYWY